MQLPSLDTILDVAPIAIRALVLWQKVVTIEPGRVWSVNSHIVRWDGAGFVCDCTNWELHHTEQHGLCKHALAVCLRSEAYRIQAEQELEEVVHV